MHKVVLLELFEDSLMVIFDPLLNLDSLRFYLSDSIVNFFKNIQSLAGVVDCSF